MKTITVKIKDEIQIGETELETYETFKKLVKIEHWEKMEVRITYKEPNDKVNNIYRYGDFEETAKLMPTFRTYYTENTKGKTTMDLDV